VFSLNFGIANPNPSLFLGNVYWKLANKMKTVITTVFYIMKLSLSSCLKFKKYFHESDIKKNVMPLTYCFSWLQEVILYTVKSLNSVSWKAHLKMMQSFFVHNCFSIIQVMGLNEEKT